MKHEPAIQDQDTPEKTLASIEDYLKKNENKELLRFLTCGNVDDGKSTLIGRLLHDSKAIYEDQLESLTRESLRSGSVSDEGMDLTLLVDGLQAEREQGITIDVAYRYFSTSQRKFIIADTPGHEQYTRNMATGASNCQLAIILIDARYGVQTQTRRHSYIASLLGIQHIIVAINKMDLLDYSQQTFNDIESEYKDFSEGLDINTNNIHFVPISALKGDNIVNSSQHMPWYSGDTLIHLLEHINISENTGDGDLGEMRFPVQYVNRPSLYFRGYCGTLASGVVHVGDTIVVLPSGKSSKIKEVIGAGGKQQTVGVKGESITLTLEDEIDISRGDMLVPTSHTAKSTDSITATVVWMAEQPLALNKCYHFKVGVDFVSGTLKSIHQKIDVNTLEKHQGDTLAINEIATCEFTLNKPVIVDSYKSNRTTGAFIVIDRLTDITVGAGMVI